MSLTDTNPNFENKAKSYKFICCDGFGCSNEAKVRISASGGTFGNILLNLCHDCRTPFENQDVRSPK